MAKPFRSFDFEIGIDGAKVVAAREPLMSNSKSDDEIDAHINRLMSELEELRDKMKAAVREHDAQPLGLRKKRD